MGTFTPSVLLELYVLLSDDDKAAFRSLLAGYLTAEQVYLILDALPVPEQGRFTSAANRQFITIATPKLVLEAIRIARKYPEKKNLNWQR